MKRIAVLYFLSLPVITIAQKNEQINPNLASRLSLKLSNTFSYQWERTTKIDSNSTTKYSSDEVDYLQISPAVQWKTKNYNLQEIEISTLSFGKYKDRTERNFGNGVTIAELPGSKTAHFDFAFRYEYLWVFNKRKNTRWIPSIGIGAMPYLSVKRYMPGISSDYPVNSLNIGARIFVEPRLTYFISKRAFVDINIPVNAADIVYQRTNQQNPALPAYQQKSDIVTVTAPAQLFNFRIGVGMML